MYSKDSSGSLHGYTNFTLSYFDPSDFEPRYYTGGSNDQPAFCRYFDYRNHPDNEDAYKLTDVYWHILAAKLAFVVIFQVIDCILLGRVSFFRNKRFMVDEMT